VPTACAKHLIQTEQTQMSVRTARPRATTSCDRVCSSRSGRRLPCQRWRWSSGRSLGDGDEFEPRVAVGLGDESLHQGVHGGLEVRSGGRGDAQLVLEDGSGFLGRDPSNGVVAGVAAAAQGDPSGGAGVVHPRHRLVGGDQPLRAVVVDDGYRVGAGRPVLRPRVVSR
jgi:hypothetical protein